MAETGDIEKAVETVTDLLLASAPHDFLPRDIIALVVGQMVHNVAKGASA